jgi:phosphatidylserine/phosphatidylglycerophosphate/cardiolipin synthase-like enzyme
MLNGGKYLVTKYSKLTANLWAFIAFFVLTNASFAADFYDNSTNAPHLSLIQGASSSLDIEIYTMNDPLIHQAILDAEDRGVKVRIIQEPAPVGAACKIFNEASSKDPAGCDDLRSFVSEVQSKGGEYVPYNKSAFCGGKKVCYEHGKVMLVDRATALISSGNFDTTSLCDTANGATRCNRDYSVVTQDAGEVQTLETIFESDLAGQDYDLQSLVDQIPSMTLTVSPYSLSPLVAFIQSAQSSIQVQNQYLHDDDLNSALEDAARRGVQVQLMVSSICSFGKPSASAVNEATTLANDFQSAGIDARVFTSKIQVNGEEGYLHAKSIIVDHQSAWVGSVNGSETALSVNREYGIFFNDANAVAALGAIHTADFNNPAGTSLADDASCY